MVEKGTEDNKIFDKITLRKYRICLIGGNEINPSHMQVSFDDSIQSDAPWEFNPHGEIKDNVCTKGDSSIVWEEGKGNRSFTTGQLIVQEGFMLQFKVNINQHLVGYITHFQFNSNENIFINKFLL